MRAFPIYSIEQRVAVRPLCVCLVKRSKIISE
nr:MAG TPA: hypothetical protein [Caudoviricetes sp.]